MACKVLNIVSASLCSLAILFAFISLDPKKAGGFVRVKARDEATNGKQRMLLHPFYVSLAKNGTGDSPDEDTDCNGWAEGDGGNNMDQGKGIGLTEDPRCYANLLRATKQPVNVQRIYANILMGATPAADSDGNCALRKMWANGTVQSDEILGQSAGAFGTAGDKTNVNQLLDTVFMLAQGSGTFLAFGMVLNILALLFGGFVWKWSDKCPYGICAFIFNSTILASLAVACYIISLCAFASIHFQGQAIDSDITCSSANLTESLAKVNYSPGGALVICSVLFLCGAIVLSGIQWYKDKKEAKAAEGVDVQNVQPDI